MRRKLKKILKENTIESISLLLSFIAIIVSVVTFGKNVELQEKSTRYNTYNMDLNYQFEFPDKFEEDDISIDNKLITIKDKQFIKIVPKVGGIQKIYFVFYREDNVTVMVPYDMYTQGVVDTYEAQDGSYCVYGFLSDIIAEDDNKYYSSVILLIEDYKHNFFSNMIILEVDKMISNVGVRVYEEIELLHALNKEEEKGDMPEFDKSQMKEYLSFKEKINEILKN